jgi:hypothetical protein
MRSRRHMNDFPHYMLMHTVNDIDQLKIVFGQYLTACLNDGRINFQLSGRASADRIGTRRIYIWHVANSSA